MLKPEQFIAAAAVHFKPDDDSLTERIRHSSAQEAEVLEGLRTLGKTTQSALTEGVASWEEEDGLVYFKGKLYVPNERALRREVLQTCHDNLTAGHPGKNGTLELVSRYYWWPRMAAFVAAYVEGCDRCQRYRQDHYPTAPVLLQEVPEGPWQTIGVDMIVGLPESKGKNAILTVVDHYTKQVHLLGSSWPSARLVRFASLF